MMDYSVYHMLEVLVVDHFYPVEVDYNFLRMMHCVKSVQVRSFSGPYFTVFGSEKKPRVWTFLTQ